MCTDGDGKGEQIWKNNDVEMQCHARIYGFPDKWGSCRNVGLFTGSSKRRAIVFKKSELFKERILRSDMWF